MDQDAFRKLLSSSTPRTAPTSSSATRFGAAPPKRGAELKEEVKQPAFKPRATAKTKEWKEKKKTEKSLAEADGAYRDRAAERRLGKASDFSAAEQLLEDFKARSAGAEDQGMVEEQMKYLGGDAEHSVLVKGLDMALLERMKAKDGQEVEKSIQEVEDELDAVLSEKKASQPKKRTRDEILKELKASRASGPVGEEQTVPAEKQEDGLEKAKKAGKFRPIGAPPPGKGKPPKEGEKKRRKKVKPAASVTDSAPIASTSTPPAPSPALPPPPPAPSIPEVEIDSDADIFGDVGEYKGMSDSDDSDNDKDPSSKPTTSSSTLPLHPPTLPVANSTASKRKYFDDDDDRESSTVGASTAPSAITNIARDVANEGASGDADAPKREEGEAEEDVPMKLQPLSGAGPSIRDLLDMDKAAEKEEKRKAKKLKNGPALPGEKREKTMTDEDKANHDYQQMMNHLSKKEKKS